MGRFLMVVGAILFVLGALAAAGVKVPLGRLPGDIVIRRENASFYFPIVTSLVLSAVLSGIFWLLRR